MKQQPEYHLCCEVCKHLNKYHSKVLFMTDTIASVHLTGAQGKRNKMVQKSDFKTPDLIIFQPNKYFHGLFIEMKVETPFKKDGAIKASQDDHLLKQQQTLQRLTERGYCACFSWTLEQTIKIIETYLHDC
jgi:glycerophosphoryl diester phosphodiesterase